MSRLEFLGCDEIPLRSLTVNQLAILVEEQGYLNPLKAALIAYQDLADHESALVALTQLVAQANTSLNCLPTPLTAHVNVISIILAAPTSAANQRF
jgi:hypothetical protein